MKTKQYHSLGLNVNIEVPESVDEFDTLAKLVGSCLDEATNNVVYRGSLADFREQFCDLLEKETSIEREVKDTGKMDAKGAPVTAFAESEAEYIKRVVAKVGGEVTQFQHIADTIKLVLDPSAPERKPSLPKKLAKVYTEAAAQVIAAGKADHVAQKLADILGHPVLTDEKSLAQAIKEKEDKQRQSLTASLMA